MVVLFSNPLYQYLIIMSQENDNSFEYQPIQNEYASPDYDDRSGPSQFVF